MPLTEDDLRRRLATQNWTAHNIELLPGVCTVPGAPLFLSANLQLQSILRLLDLLYPQGLRGLRVADLGSLEGGFALAFALRGADVVGFEVRPENIEKCELVKQQHALPNLEFIRADVKGFHVATYGAFDIVLAMGILYHLDEPALWLDQIAQATKAVLVVDTHFAPADDHALAAVEQRLQTLGPIEKHMHGSWPYEGRWFHEYQTEDERNSMPWASYSNPSSFWLTKASLFASLATLGRFGIAMELFDLYADQYGRFAREFPRCMCVGIKPAGVAAARGASSGAV